MSEESKSLKCSVGRVGQRCVNEEAHFLFKKKKKKHTDTS